MRIIRDDSRDDLLGPDDDSFHASNDFSDLFLTTDPRWFHETTWFWWFVPEDRIGGWFYNWVRPNIGTSGGGAWVWDDTTPFHFEVPYYACYSNLAHDPGADLRHYRFPSGVSVDCLEPLTKYRLRFADRDIIDVDLEFEAVLPPWVTSVGVPESAIHFDQVGLVTGAMILNGVSHTVNCFAMRDRTWTPRSERWKTGRVGYANACNERVAFLVNATAREQIHAGYFVKDGRRAKLIDGTREIERDPEHGFLRRIVVEAEDGDGRRFRAVGEGVSRMAIPIPGVHGVVWTSLVDWQVDGQQAWGEDQDAWPIREWSAFRRAQSGA
jgi:hypothetical protein